MAADLPAVDKALQSAREAIEPRVDPAQLEKELANGALIVDIRPVESRVRDGDLPGAVVIDRNVLEWRLDPTSPHRLPEMTGADRRVVLVCNEGYASTLAAAGLRGLGLEDVTDLAGGYQAWLESRP